MERKESASVQTHAEISGGTPIWIKSTEKLIIISFVNSVKNHFLLMETVKESIAVINAMFRTDINRRSMMDNTNKVVLADKYTLTIKEAVTYFNIGEKKKKTCNREHWQVFHHEWKQVPDYSFKIRKIPRFNYWNINLCFIGKSS